MRGVDGLEEREWRVSAGLSSAAIRGLLSVLPTERDLMAGPHGACAFEVGCVRC